MKLPQFGDSPKGVHLDKVLASPNFIKGRFRNQQRIKEHMSLVKVPTLIKQNNNKQIEKQPPQNLPISLDALYRVENVDSDLLRFTWFGHSSLLLETDGKRILIDPMLGEYASPVPGTVKRFSKMPIDWSRVGHFDLIILSHDHYDHLDYKTFKQLKDKCDQIVCPLAVGAHLRSWGTNASIIHECDWHDQFEFRGIKLTSCPTKHFSGRTPKTRDQSLWCSWVIETKTHKVFFSSDSGYDNHFSTIGTEQGPFDLCFVECGQYNHLWKENHMFPEESLQAFIDVNGKLMVPIHWGAFSLAPHDWRDPVERLLKEAERKNVENIILPRLGESCVLGREYPKDRWWQKKEG